LKQFATCLSCIDGRIHLPVIQWIMDNHYIDYVDLITEPGMIKWLLEDENIKDNLLSKILISRQKHNSSKLFIVAHYDCAGNPVSDQKQKEQINIAVNKMSNILLEIDVIGLWVNENGEVNQIN